MAANTKRLMITVPLDLQTELDGLKEEAAFANKNRSDVLRQLIRIGLETAGKEDSKTNMFAAVGRH